MGCTRINSRTILSLMSKWVGTAVDRTETSSHAFSFRLACLSELLTDMTTRACRVCHVEKPLTEFAEYNHDGGRRHECKPCMNDRRLKYFDSEWVVEKARVKVHNLTLIYAGPSPLNLPDSSRLIARRLMK